MKWSLPAWCLLGALAVFVPVGLRVLSWQEKAPPEILPADARAGQVLFVHEWQPHDPLCQGGEGLGPVYNDVSCVNCHNLGGAGGAGGLEHNVTTFVVASADGGRRDGVVHAYAVAEPFQEKLSQVHSALPPLSRPSLKQIIGNPEENRNGPRQPRMAVGRAGCAVPLRPQAEDEQINIPSGVQLGQRNTPALFGAGLLDAIPDRVILANARKQRLRYGLAPADTDRVPVGRPARLPDGRVGKFGWKGQAASLSDFVQAACANELGLSNPGHEQPRPLGKPDYQAVGYDLTQKQCDQMTSFVASLPRPVERLPADPGRRAAAERGKALFNRVGCAGCHTPDLGSVSGVYSDLLLHRMGEDLQSGGNSYGGAPPPIPDRSPGDGPQADEWRTPPLWGVADSGPYLHDGRAATLEQAIRMHGGQGARAARRFERLTPADQARLIAFLKTLRAPPPADLH